MFFLLTGLLCFVCVYQLIERKSITVIATDKADSAPAAETETRSEGGPTLSPVVPMHALSPVRTVEPTAASVPTTDTVMTEATTQGETTPPRPPPPQLPQQQQQQLEQPVIRLDESPVRPRGKKRVRFQSDALLTQVKEVEKYKLDNEGEAEAAVESETAGAAAVAAASNITQGYDAFRKSSFGNTKPSARRCRSYAAIWLTWTTRHRDPTASWLPLVTTHRLLYRSTNQTVHVRLGGESTERQVQERGERNRSRRCM